MRGLSKVVALLARVSLVLTLLSATNSSRAFAQGPTAILDRMQVNPRRQIDFHAIALPESVYVGQQATYQIAVLISPEARSRLRRNPEFLPPELRGLLAYELGSLTRVPPRNYDGGVFEAHVFQRALFPVAAGRQTVPAPSLTYSLPQSSSYFSREERFVVRAESAQFVVRSLPEAGRPDDFNGAVGIFKSSVRIDTTSARVGDPLVLTLRVQGTGNVKLLPRPSIELDWASTVSGSERVMVDSSGQLVRGTKEFDWILTPARDGRVTVPVLRYSYFDPYAARYAVAESSPLELSVREGSLATVDESEAGALLPLRNTPNARETVVHWNGSGLPPAAWIPWFVVLLLAPLPTLWWWRRSLADAVNLRSGAAVAKKVSDANRARAVADGSARDTARTVRRSLLESLATRFGQNPQALVSRRFVARVLRRGGVTRATTRDVMTLLERLDELGFAELEPDAASAQWATGAANLVTELLRRIDTEAMPRGRQFGVSSLLAFVVVFGALQASVFAHDLSAQAQAQSVETTTAQSMDARASAVQSYDRRAFSDASERFKALAILHPDDADVLANWGTAAWANGDTVSAVIAWQRASRIDPLALDLQERVSLLPSGARGGVADIPMVPVRLLLRLAITLWLIGWGLFAVRAWRAHNDVQFRRSNGSRWMHGGATTAVVLSVLCAGAGWWGLRALDASTLAVVARPETLRIAPGTDADAMGGVTTGDVVRTEDSRDAWTRVTHADGRRGWLPMQRLVALHPAARASGDRSDPVLITSPGSR